jgi:hypothetical protein
MSHRPSRLGSLAVALPHLTFAAMACILLAGCGTGRGSRGGVHVQPPYVEDDPKAKAQDACQAQSQGSQDKTAKDACKKPESK